MNIKKKSKIFSNFIFQALIQYFKLEFKTYLKITHKQ
jgi:hypothetical protein